MAIVLDMFININAIRYAYVNGKIIRVPKKDIKVCWPEHIIELAKMVYEGGYEDSFVLHSFALHDALLDLGLEKNAKHFLNHGCKSCYYAGLICRSVNPDWGGSWCFNSDEDKITYLEIQAELEEYWCRGIVFEENVKVREWCDKANASIV